MPSPDPAPMTAQLDGAADHSSVVEPWIMGDVRNSTVVTAGRDVHITLSNGNVLSVQEDYWPDFTDLVARATRWFAGRGFVFEAFGEFLAEQKQGYFRLVAAAGLGKTAIAAELARRYRAPAYFLSASAGRTSPETALNALSAQVIARYGLPHTTVPITAGATSDWLKQRLKEAAAAAAGGPVVVVIDALDEADAVPRGHNWLHLPEDLPERVYVVLTQREGTYQLRTDAGIEVKELAIKPDDADQQVDIEAYLRRQVKRDEIRQVLAAAAQPVSDETFVATLKSRSQGNFMYLGYVLESIANRPPGASPIDLTELPRGLTEYYRQVWNQLRPPMEKPADWETWDSLLRPVIELLAVAGEPVTANWLGALTGRSPNMISQLALEKWTRFLMSGPKQGKAATWSIVHRSFADFLAEEVDLIAAHRAVADHYVTDSPVLDFDTWDEYGLRYAATHLAEAGRSQPVKERRQLVERLVRLVEDRHFHAHHMTRLRAPDALRRDLERALAGAGDASASTPALLTRAALSVGGFSGELIKTVDLFEHAAAGDVDAAERQLSLFDLEPDSDWQRALRLAIAWLAHPRNPVAARALRGRARAELPASSTLELLQQRVDAALDGTPEPPLPPLPPPPNPHDAERIVDRLAGATDESLKASGRELLMAQTERLVEGGYISGDPIQFLAEIDGPLLVAFVAALPDVGAEYFAQYLLVHSRYSYTTYRRGSLWALLDSVLHHPSADWTRGALASVGRTALEGGDVEFEEALGFATMALAVRAERPGAAEHLQTRYAPNPAGDGPYPPELPDTPPGAVTVAPQSAPASELRLHYPARPRQSNADPWAARKRRLGALAEALTALVGQPAASVLVDQALLLPFGFAGYQAPACLSLAESMVIAHTGVEDGVPRVLAAARVAARNIQDPLLWARTNARVEAMRARWWSLFTPFPVLETAQHLRHDPSAVEFSALHTVGEADLLPPEEAAQVPGTLRSARTLRDFADAYQRPLAEFCRLNAAQTADPDEPLPGGMPLNVPDGRLATLLAARIAAQALVDPGLTADERVRAIWLLVPVAVGNPTALDSVLARLLIATALSQPRPTLPALLAEFESIQRTRQAIAAADSAISVVVRHGGAAPG